MCGRGSKDFLLFDFNQIEKYPPQYRRISLSPQMKNLRKEIFHLRCVLDKVRMNFELNPDDEN